MGVGGSKTRGFVTMRRKPARTVSDSADGSSDPSTLVATTLRLAVVLGRIFAVGADQDVDVRKLDGYLEEPKRSRSSASISADVLSMFSCEKRPPACISLIEAD
jgi:hypothetical protein